MSLQQRWVWVAALLCVLQVTNCQFPVDPFDSASSSDVSSVSSESISIFEDFNMGDEPFVQIRNVIFESRSLVMSILRGRVPSEVANQVKRQYPKLTRFFEGVTKSTRQCLRKFPSRSDKIRNAARCYLEAVKKRQNEEEEEEVGEEVPMQDCVQEAMIEAATKAAPLVVMGQDLYQRYRNFARETARKLMSCREDVSPFECVRSVWVEAATDAVMMRDEAMALMSMSRELYTEFSDSMKFCLTPVEETEPEEEYDEEEKKVTTEGTKCAPPNEYDSVQSESVTRAAEAACSDKPQP